MGIRDRIRGMGARMRDFVAPTLMAQPMGGTEAPMRPSLDRKLVSGTRISGGRIWGKEQNADLKGRKWPVVAEEMRRTEPVLMAAERALINTQLTATWRFTVPDDAPPLAIEARDFLNDNFGFGGARGRLSGGWESVLGQMLLFQPYGFRYMEEVYSIREWRGKTRVWVDFADCEPTAHDQWKTAPDGSLEAVVQQTIGGDERQKGKPAPASQLVVLTHGRTGNDFGGLGLLRPCWFPWKLKSHTLDQIGIGVERWAVGTPRAKWNLKALREDQQFSPEQITDLQENAKATIKAYLAHESGYLAGPEGIDFDVFGEGVLDAAGPAAIVDLCDRQMMTAWGLQFLLLGVNDTGSRAVGDVQESFFRRQAVNALDQIAANVGGAAGPGRGTLGRLMRWNYPALPPEQWPRMEHRGLDPGPLLELLSVLPGLVQAGVVTRTNRLENAILDAFKQPPLAKMYEREPDERGAMSSPVGAAATLYAESRRTL